MINSATAEAQLDEFMSSLPVELQHVLKSEVCVCLASKTAN